jgi:acyl carrier protein
VTDEHIRETLRTYIFTNLLPGEAPESLEDSTRLITSGVVTSLSLLELVTFIEETWSLRLEEDDLGAWRMDSVEKMVELIRERLGAARADT